MSRDDDARFEEARQAIGRPAKHFLAHAQRLREAASLRPVLDLACGRGRHGLAAAELGLAVLALDRNREALETLQALPLERGSIETLEFDLESGSVPPLSPGGFGAILVFRYLHRPLMPWIASLLAPGGLLLYETFTVAQRSLGWGPSRDDFLLDEGELPTLFPDLVIEDYAEGLSEDDPAAQTGRLVASRPL